LKQLRQSVGREVGALWRKSEWHSAWFDRACLPKLEDALDELVVNEIRRARNFERQHLENPRLSLIAIVAARTTA